MSNRLIYGAAAAAGLLLLRRAFVRLQLAATALGVASMAAEQSGAR